jgi:hypothetical protein
MIVTGLGTGVIALRHGAGKVRTSMIVLLKMESVVVRTAVVFVLGGTDHCRPVWGGFRSSGSPSEWDLRKFVVELIERRAAGTDAHHLRAGERVLGGGEDRVAADDVCDLVE